MFEDGKRCLSNYYKKFNDSGYLRQNVLAVEYKFNIKIGNYEFIGFIDRIDKDDNIISIIDYKTGTKPHTLSKLKKDLQLYIYEMVIRNNDDFKGIEKITLNLFYLKKDTYLSCMHSNEEIYKLEKKILHNIELIESDKIYNGKESILCDWCYFWSECEYKSINNPSIRINRNEFFNNLP